MNSIKSPFFSLLLHTFLPLGKVVFNMSGLKTIGNYMCVDLLSIGGIYRLNNLLGFFFKDTIEIFLGDH